MKVVFIIEICKILHKTTTKLKYIRKIRRTYSLGERRFVFFITFSFKSLAVVLVKVLIKGRFLKNPDVIERKEFQT